MRCRICDHPAPEKFLSLGTLPLANNFLKAEDFSRPEPRYPLELAFCPQCSLVQLTEVVPPEVMFRHYVYVTSTTKTFQEHFRILAEEVTRIATLSPGDLVVDIGSNDGLLLKRFKALGAAVVGIEPAANLAKMAEGSGIETVNAFFGKDAVDEVLRRHGKARAITATNVFAHMHDVKSAVTMVKELLAEEGVFAIEVQSLPDMLEKMTFDNIYHEHLSYFSVLSLTELFQTADMEIFHVEHVESHGGSLRVYIQQKGVKRRAEPSVERFRERERSVGMKDIRIYRDFARRVTEVRDSLVQRVRSIRSEGKTIACYGAPAKGNTLLCYCGLGNEELQFVVEDNPLKVGLYTPGSHLPVVDRSVLEDRPPDWLLILAWNFADEIASKTQHLRERGVRFLVPLPKLREIGKPS